MILQMIKSTHSLKKGYEGNSNMNSTKTVRQVNKYPN